VRGLPSSVREVDLFCAECGAFLGSALIDEMDTLDAADVVCGRCFEKADKEADDDAECYDDHCDQHDDIEELEAAAEGADRLRKAGERASDLLRALEFDLRNPTVPARIDLRRIEKARELLDDALREAVKL
jgi:hypothetical protein